MTRLVWLFVGLIVLFGGMPGPVGAQSDGEVVAKLPGSDAAHGLAIGPDDHLYVSDIGGSREASIFVYDSSGKLRDQFSISAGPSGQIALRGLVFDRSGNLFVADAANGRPERGRIIKINPRGRQSVFASGLTAPVGLAMDRSGILYVTDALNGAVHWISPEGASAVFTEGDDLKPRDKHEQGASGLAFSRNERALYVSNASKDRILRVGINSDGSAGSLSVLVDGPTLRRAGRPDNTLNGPEGLAVDNRGNILAAVSRADRVELFSPEGRMLGRLPERGPAAFSWPTAIALAGNTAFVANLAEERGASHISRFSVEDLYDE